MRALEYPKLFDREFYRLRYPGAAAEGADLLQHYCTIGWQKGYAPHPLFDPDHFRSALGSRPLLAAPLEMFLAEHAPDPHPLFWVDWYLDRNRDVRQSGANPLAHYLETGWREGRSPHPLFDPLWYIDAHPEARNCGMEPLTYFVVTGAMKGHNPHWLFDTGFYLAHAPEAVAARINPLIHYLSEGAANGRDPHPLFCTSWYLGQNPDVVANGINPLIHFIEHGGYAGRSPHPLVDLEWYRSQYPDAARSGENLLKHLLGFNGNNLRNPAPEVDLGSFAEHFPSAPMHPLVHYVLHGEKLLGRSRRRPRAVAPSTGPGSGPTGESEFRERVRKLGEDRRSAFRPEALDLPRCRAGDEESFLRQIEFIAAQDPLVSIVVPVFNMAAMGLECLLSVQNCCQDVDYEVIIADDASSADQSEIFSRVRGAIHIRNERNLGFLRNCNNAVRTARGRFLLLLNSDVQLMSGAVRALIAAYEPGVGITGPKILYPSGHLQEAGCRINVDGSAVLIGLGEDPQLPEYNFRRSVEYVSGACMLIDRHLFEELGGFDARYAPAYCEDADLCYRARERGLRVVYEPAAGIAHHLSQTMSQLQSDFKRRQAAINTQKLVERWQDRIETDNRAHAIAIYLPQYHRVPENDLWWGSGFTEWSNVAKAAPNYVGHYQPRHPADLGYYDLSNIDTFMKQIRLARRYGLSGFSFYYYWFRRGRRILEGPIETYLATPKLDFPFCLCWANENWTRRWDGMHDDVLLEQEYTHEDDVLMIRDVARFFTDRRYWRIGGRPLFSIYRWDLLPDVKATVDCWRRECRRLGVGEIYVAAFESFDLAGRLKHPADIGCDATIGFPPHNLSSPEPMDVRVTNSEFSGFVDSYQDVAVRCATQIGKPFTRFPGVSPQWDNTARRQHNPYILHGSEPGTFKDWLEYSFDSVRRLNAPGERLVFLNAWNEWAEGAYIEPDLRFGHSYLEAVRHAVEAPTARRLP